MNTRQRLKRRLRRRLAKPKGVWERAMRYIAAERKRAVVSQRPVWGSFQSPTGRRMGTSPAIQNLPIRENAGPEIWKAFYGSQVEADLDAVAKAAFPSSVFMQAAQGNFGGILGGLFGMIAHADRRKRAKEGDPEARKELSAYRRSARKSRAKNRRRRRGY